MKIKTVSEFLFGDKPQLEIKLAGLANTNSDWKKDQEFVEQEYNTPTNELSLYKSKKLIAIYKGLTK